MTAPAARIFSTVGSVVRGDEILQRRCAFARRVSRHVEVDLHGEGHAVQRTERLARSERGVSGVGLCEDFLGPNLDDGVDLVVYLLDALEVRRDDFSRGDFTGANALGQRRRGRSPQFI